MSLVFDGSGELGLQVALEDDEAVARAYDGGIVEAVEL